MKELKQLKSTFTDVAIVGGGIAGLSVAIKLAKKFPQRQITVFSKDGRGVSNTMYAQGGLAVALDVLKDTFQQHIDDTLKVGDGLCVEEVVETVVCEAPARLRELLEMGVPFDRSPSGNLSLGLEGGHSANRIVHVKDQTGAAIMSTLLGELETLTNVTVVWNATVLDLAVQKSEDGNTCNGVSVLSTDGLISTIGSSFTVLATGGIGQLYEFTTNPCIATGDGISMAYRAGAEVSHMQYVQFHPTALKTNQGETAFLISEALRGFGAHLVTNRGDRFLFAYDARGELAPRDIVARAVFVESLLHPVFLDCRHLDPSGLRSQFPGIDAACLSQDIDITKERIPVAPAAHYLCGGITTNRMAQTTIDGLYAVGECANTGLHGANRLASNSLIEALVFAHRCAMDISSKVHRERSVTNVVVKTVDERETEEAEWLAIQTQIKRCMTLNAGIVRSTAGLKAGLGEVLVLKNRVEKLVKQSKPHPQLFRTRNMVTVAMLILQQSLRTPKNAGTFFNRDLATDIPEPCSFIGVGESPIKLAPQLLV